MSRVALGELTNAICNTLLSPSKATFFSPSKAARSAPQEKLKAVEAETEIEDVVANIEKALSEVKIDDEAKECTSNDVSLADSCEDDTDTEAESEIGPEDDPEQDVSVYEEEEEGEDEDEEEEVEEEAELLPAERVALVEEKFDALRLEHDMAILKPSCIKFGKKVRRKYAAACFAHVYTHSRHRPGSFVTCVC
jgi:hypothetical protein